MSVAGQPVSDLWDYSLMFVALAQGGVEPVLYHRGKRVVKPWKLSLEADMPLDPWGAAGGAMACDKEPA